MTTKADQVRSMVEAAKAAGLVVTEIVVEPKRIVIKTLGESAAPADAADAWLRGKHACKAGRRA